jgi:hypothetical protein
MFKIELVIFFGGWAPPFLVALEVVHESFLVRGRMPTKEWWLGSNVVFSSFFFFFSLSSPLILHCFVQN